MLYEERTDRDRQREVRKHCSLIAWCIDVVLYHITGKAFTVMINSWCGLHMSRRQKTANYTQFVLVRTTHETVICH